MISIKWDHYLTGNLINLDSSPSSDTASLSDLRKVTSFFWASVTLLVK